MGRRYLTTVGISLLTNAERDLNKSRNDLTAEDLKNFLRKTDSRAASAELNTLDRVGVRGHSVVLLHTATNFGRLCAEALRWKLEDDCTVSLHQIGMREEGGSAARRGLRRFIEAIVEEIHTAHDRHEDPWIVATGGFKVETAYATVLAMVHHLPCVYIHETFHEIVELPPLPIDWDLGLLYENRDFFEWVGETLRPRSEVDRRLAGRPEADRIRELLIVEDDLVMFSEVGFILWGFFSTPPRVTELPESRVDVTDRVQRPTDEHHWPNGMIGFCERLAALPFVEEIRPRRFTGETRTRVIRPYTDGTVHVSYSDGNYAARLVVETTASNMEEARFAADEIQRRIG